MVEDITAYLRRMHESGKLEKPVTLDDVLKQFNRDGKPKAPEPEPEPDEGEFEPSDPEIIPYPPPSGVPVPRLPAGIDPKNIIEGTRRRQVRFDIDKLLYSRFNAKNC